MEVINFKTGRTYDTAQVLEITVLADHIGESGLRDVIILFIPAPLWSVTQEIMCR